MTFLYPKIEAITGLPNRYSTETIRWVPLLIVVGNLLTIVLFVVNKELRKKSLFLVINMAFTDLKE